ncbi:MAG: radical SAM protein [Candidatus Thorarchaeota archaeon]|jgi:pyruvate formate lyase activating enzyme
MLCPNHHADGRLISRSIGYCQVCLEENPSLSETVVGFHGELRERESLVPHVPSAGNTVCPECGNHCRLDDDAVGFCNLRVAQKGKIIERYPDKAVVSWYFDPLPTNCVADWVCPVTTKKELGLGRNRLNNLAVFYGSCSSDCLYCQNSSYQNMMATGKPLMTPDELAGEANEYTACVCYFGGDPACNPRHSLEVSKRLIEQHQTRVCYETNGNISGKWHNHIADTVWKSGGTIKFDLKAFSPSLYSALTGITNGVVLRNFRKLSVKGKDRENEFLVASILLVPGYIGESEIQKLCDFIADCDPTVPTALLGFHPHHAMTDLPRTSRYHADAASIIAKDCGLTNVRIGNKHLLSSDNYRFS